MRLNELEIGHSATVREVGGTGALRQHFLDMGLIPGVEVTLVKYAPMGDPLEVRLHGYELTLRKADAGQIEVVEIDKATQGTTRNGTESIKPNMPGIEAAQVAEHAHPGLGEPGKFHHHEGEHPLPVRQTLTFALIGNQNCGKTTLFNQLTGPSNTWATSPASR